jgi:quercetin dioxygenase-like cupin family protein
MSEPFLENSDGADALWFFGTLALVKAGGDRTAGALSLVEQTARRGVATPLHVQDEDQETFYILDGELTFFVEDGTAIRAQAGDVVHVPAGVPHAFQVDSETARWLDVTTLQHERFFRAAGKPAPTRELPPDEPPDIDRVMSLADEYGIRILGPPPGQ